jgi:hypothetical protein
MKYLVDTNVISELRKGERCDDNVRSWFASIPSEDIFLSVLTVGEIRRGIEGIRRRDRDAAAVLERWLGQVVGQHQGHILPIDREIAEEWGRLGVPDRIPVLDGLIAATARVRGLTVATRNLSDMARTGVRCVNPFVESDSIREELDKYSGRTTSELPPGIGAFDSRRSDTARRSKKLLERSGFGDEDRKSQRPARQRRRHARILR